MSLEGWRATGGRTRSRTRAATGGGGPSTGVPEFRQARDGRRACRADRKDLRRLSKIEMGAESRRADLSERNASVEAER